MKYKFAFLLLTLCVLSINSFAQNKFEGYNIVVSVPEDHNQATCAIRYVPPTTDIIISDLNPATPMNLKSCSGSGSRLTRNSSTSSSVRASAADYKWCFEGEDESYRISFQGDRYKRQVVYNWIANPDERNRGLYNIKDFGAVGNGSTDDTIAIESAMAYIAAHNGGTLQFPEGDYIVSSPIALPSGIVIKGTNGLHSGASTNNVIKKNSSRITLRGANKALFQIGECMEKIAFEDIELYAESDDKTYGVEGKGAYYSAQGVSFDRVTFNHFWRGIHVQGLPQTNLNWQFDYVKIKESRFIFNKDAGLYCNTRNSDWKIESSLFINPKRTSSVPANSMHFERIGMVTIQDTFGGGYINALGGTFINILDSGPITIIGTQTENMTNSLVYNEVENPYAGDYSFPITIVNSVFGNQIKFKARRTFVSTGSLYLADTFVADSRVRVYSTGDRFCYDGNILGCQGATKKNFDQATVIFMTGQPSEGSVQGHPTYFGTDVEFGSPVKMPNYRHNLLPNGKPNGSMIYCEDCQRGDTPCRSGGSGSPAMVVNGRWSCL
jgi:hypothetical protein